MSVESELAHQLGRRDEQPNIELAERIVRATNYQAVGQLIGLLDEGTRASQNDSIKVLYEIGERKVALIAPYTSAFLRHIHGRNNRLVWGCMTALAHICADHPSEIADHLEDVVQAAAAGSVIAKDQMMNILVILARNPPHQHKAIPLMLDQLERSADNQFPKYAEQISAVSLTGGDSVRFVGMLQERYALPLKPSQKKRIAKVLKRLG